MIAIIDYDAGNLKSVEKALWYIGEKAVITRDPKILKSADHVILPGVGAFGDAMEKLHNYKLVDVIYDIIEMGKPFLGICLGLQLLFEWSDESNVKGLSVLKGKILKIPDNKELKIPHMGWNSIKIRKGTRLLEGIAEDSYVYFVHSYYLKAEQREEVAAFTEYVTEIHAAVEKENIFACQFHPEKSGETGLQILRNFVKVK